MFESCRAHHSYRHCAIQFRAEVQSGRTPLRRSTGLPMYGTSSTPSNRFFSDLLPRLFRRERPNRPRIGVVEKSVAEAIGGTPILIYYRVQKRPQVVEILHFWHGSRRDPRI
jgi:hypothetical protein